MTREREELVCLVVSNLAWQRCLGLWEIEEGRVLGHRKVVLFLVGRAGSVC